MRILSKLRTLVCNMQMHIMKQNHVITKIKKIWCSRLFSVITHQHSDNRMLPVKLVQ